MNCKEIQELITGHLMRDLDAEKDAEVSAHLEECENCRAVMREVQPTLDLLRDALAVPPFVADKLSRDRLAAVMNARRKRNVIVRIFTSDHRRLSMVAAIIFICFIFAGMLLPALSKARERACAQSVPAVCGDPVVAMVSIKKPEPLYQRILPKSESRFAYDSDNINGTAPEPVEELEDVEAEMLDGIPDAPDEFDSVGIVKSPIVYKGVYGSRSPGARGKALAGHGGGEAPAASAPQQPDSPPPPPAMSVPADRDSDGMPGRVDTVTGEVKEATELKYGAGVSIRAGKMSPGGKVAEGRADVLAGEAGGQAGAEVKSVNAIGFSQTRDGADSPFLKDTKEKKAQKSASTIIKRVTDLPATEEIPTAPEWSDLDESSARRTDDESYGGDERKHEEEKERRRDIPLLGRLFERKKETAPAATETPAKPESAEAAAKSRDEWRMGADRSIVLEEGKARDGVDAGLSIAGGIVGKLDVGAAAGPGSGAADKWEGDRMQFADDESAKSSLSAEAGRKGAEESLKRRREEVLAREVNGKPAGETSAQLSKDNDRWSGRSHASLGSSAGQAAHALPRLPGEDADKSRDLTKTARGRLTEPAMARIASESDGKDRIGDAAGIVPRKEKKREFVSEADVNRMREVNDSEILKEVVEATDVSYKATPNAKAGKMGAGGRGAALQEPEEKRSDPVLPKKPRPQAFSFNPFVKTADNPFSTFAIDVDTASFTVTRNYMAKGFLPPPDVVRTEEFVNFFDYAYKAPEQDIFKVYIEGAPSKFGHGLSLLKIGVKGKRLGREEQRPAVLTFLVDTSGSMETPDRLGMVRKSLRMLVEKLNPGDLVAIVAYDSQARLVLEHTPASAKDKILAALDALQCSGSTNLEEGLKKAYEVAASGFRSKGENRVLMLSDGAANLGNLEAEELLKKVESYRKQGIFCSVFGVGIGTYDDEMLETLANKGDGTYAFIDSEEEAKRVFVDDLGATLNTIAADVKIQVEFNPARVASYRQLGYENRQLKKEQFRDDKVDAGEVGSGQSVTALYEYAPALELLDRKAGNHIAVVRVRYRRLDNGKVEEIERKVTMADMAPSFDGTGARFRLAACAAEFSEILRGSPFAADNDFPGVAEVLRPVRNELNLDGRVEELLRMVQGANGMARGE